MAKIKVWTGLGENLPTVYIHSVAGNGENVWKRCLVQDGAPQFNLVLTLTMIHPIHLRACATPSIRGLRAAC